MKKDKILSIINSILAVAVFVITLVAGIKTKQVLIKLLPTLISPFVYLLSARVSRLAYLIGGLNSVLYSVGFFLEGVYGSFVNALCISFPVQVYTFFAWRKHAYKQATQFRRMSVRSEIILGAGSVIVWTAAFFIMSSIKSANYQALDVTALVTGTLVTFLTAGAFIETIVFNVIGAVANISLWLMSMIQGNTANVTYLIMTLFSFYCCIVSAVKWILLYREQQAVIKAEEPNRRLEEERE